MLNDYFKNLKINVLNGEYAMVKSKKIYPNAFANIKDKKEITVVIEESKIQKKDIISIEKEFKIVTFDMIIPLNLIGFIAKIAQVLAKENISIFVISAYTSDYILVKKKDLKKTMNSLKKLGVKI